MLTETVAGRTYDYSHSVGRGSQTGMGFSNPVAAAIGQDGVLYIAAFGIINSDLSPRITGVIYRVSAL